MRFVPVACVLAACSAQLSQDHATGPDGVIEGATPVAFADRVARTSGTISYPYGDRVDWFAFALPAPGDARVELRWRPKGERATYVVEAWNDHHRRIARVGGQRSGVRALSVRREDLPGEKLYVRVYARGRADAGSYDLAVTFIEPPPPIDWLAIPIDEPPPLPAVPPVPPPPPPPPPPCPTPPDPSIPACRRQICRDQGGVWDPRRNECRTYPCGYPSSTADCLPPPSPVSARVLAATPHNAEVLITVSAGSDDGVERGWRGVVVGAGGTPIPNGAFTVLRVANKRAIGKVKLSLGQVHANPHVRLSPP